MLKNNHAPLALAFASALFTASAAHATFIVNIQQVGADVVATGGGTIDTAALGPGESGGYTDAITPLTGQINLGGGPNDSTYYALDSSIFSGPDNFGIGNTTVATSGTGDRVAIVPGIPDLSLIFLPVDYVSGSILADTALFANASFDSLGLDVGIFTYTFGSGDHTDSFQIRVGQAAVVPEPETIALFAAGLLAAGVAGQRRKHALKESSPV